MNDKVSETRSSALERRGKVFYEEVVIFKKNYQLLLKTFFLITEQLKQVAFNKRIIKIETRKKQYEIHTKYTR